MSENPAARLGPREERIAEYQKQAARARTLAEEAKDEPSRKAYLNLAREWDALTQTTLDSF